MKRKLFDSWQSESASLQCLIAYVQEITDPKSARFVPIEDRIVVFDMDGTLVSETLPYFTMCVYWTYRVLDDPLYAASNREREVAEHLRECMNARRMDKFDFSEDEVTYWMDTSFAGLTTEQFRTHAQKWLQTTYTPDRPDLLYSETFFRPMLEVVDYLRQSQFRIYILSASDREFCRAMVCQSLQIPPSNVIGYTVRYRAERQGESESRAYILHPGEATLRTNHTITFNESFSKVESIINEIGQRPLLAFGNSSGDFSMFEYVVDGRTDGYSGKAFLLLPDDTIRENGDLSRAKRYLTECEKTGYIPISKSTDWLTLF